MSVLQQLGFLPEHEVAGTLGVEVSTLRNWRSKGIGPAYSRAGGMMLYPIDGLKAYLDDNLVTPSPTPTLADPEPRRPGRPRKQQVARRDLEQLPDKVQRDGTGTTLTARRLARTEP